MNHPNSKRTGSASHRPPTNLLLLDVGNTHTHVAIAQGKRILRRRDFPTHRLSESAVATAVIAFVGRRPWLGSSLCSVVPRATPVASQLAEKITGKPTTILTHDHLLGVGLQYPRPESIGPDRLANAIAVNQLYGGPAVVVDFGTAVTFDVVNADGKYVGGIIAPGLAAMTEYLHEKTALLPKIKIREPRSIIGKNTEDAMLVGAVHGYRGLVRELIAQLRQELHISEKQSLPVIATGGYAGLIARKMPEIQRVVPTLTLDGLCWYWRARQVMRPSPPDPSR